MVGYRVNLDGLVLVPLGLCDDPGLPVRLASLGVLDDRPERLLARSMVFDDWLACWYGMAYGVQPMVSYVPVPKDHEGVA